MAAMDIDEEVARHERHLELLERIRDGAWLDSQVFPPLAWAVPDIIPEGFGLLVGPPKLGKSWMALGIGLAVAAGGRALGRIPVGEARPVLYLALEDGPRRLQDRCRKLLVNSPIPKNLDFITKASPADVLDTIEAWLEFHDGKNPLVLLDTLGKVMPPSVPGESAYARDYRVGGRLKDLVDRRPGATLLVVHHTRKQGSEDWMDSTSGTNGLNGAADFTVAITRARNEQEGLLKVTGRDVPEGEYAITSTSGTWVLQGDLEQAAAVARTVRTTAGLGDRAADVVNLVNDHPEGIKAAEVARALGMDSKDADTYLRRALNAERIDKKARGVYIPKMATVIPLHPHEGTVGSVGSVGTESDETYTSYTSYTQRECDVCHLPLTTADIEGGHPTHAGCFA